MSDASTTDDDEVEEMDLPSWVREAASRCPGLVSEASLAKRKREQEQADLAFAQQLQRDEEAAAESERRAAAESERRAAATRMARENRAEPEIIFLSGSDSESPPPPPRARPNPSRLQVARSPLSPINSSPQQPVPPKRRQGRQGQSVAQTALEGQPRDHQVAGGLAPPPASLRVASLYPYQAAGFTWMLQREGVGAEATDKRVLGGLLADEQGMGKTIQALSLCLAHPPSLHAAPIGGSLSCAGGGSRAALGTLIVCPLSLLRQWQREIGSKASPPYGANGAQPCLHPRLSHA
jgi:SNF2 family DNA or RNA helicase